MEPADVDEADADEATPETRICTAESCPGRTIFSEDGNPDGWIGTDLTVEIER